MNKKFDAIVLGTGMAGLGTARALARLNQRVLVLGKTDIQGQSSPAAGGILDPLLEMKPKSPFLSFCLKAFRRRPKDFVALERSTGRRTGYRCCGMLYAAFSRAEEKILKQRFGWQKKLAIPVRWCRREWILKKEPAMNPKVLSALYYPSIGRVQPRKLLAVMLKDAKKAGVQFFYTDSSARLEIKKGKTAGVRAGKYFFEAPAVVNATGSWAGANSFLGVKPPVRPARGQILVVKRQDLKIRSILHTVNGGYIVPWDANHLLLGSTVEFAGFKPVVTSAGRKIIRAKNQKLAPALEHCREIAAWAGLRPFPKDRFPLIGPTRIPGLFMAAGFYRSGILIGDYAGHLLAKGIVSGKMPGELKFFDPRRFP